MKLPRIPSRHRLFKRLALLLICSFIPLYSALSCPACKDSFTPGSINALSGEAFSASVIFMLAVPMAILVTGALFLRSRLRRIDPNEKKK